MEPPRRRGRGSADTGGINDGLRDSDWSLTDGTSTSLRLGWNVKGKGARNIEQNVGRANPAAKNVLHGLLQAAHQNSGHPRIDGKCLVDAIVDVFGGAAIVGDNVGAREEVANGANLQPTNGGAEGLVDLAGGAGGLSLWSQGSSRARKNSSLYEGMHPSVSEVALAR